MTRIQMTVKEFDSLFSPLDINLHGVRLPEFKIEEKNNLSNKEFLLELCRQGFRDLKIDKTNKNYGDRVRYEISIIEELGFVDYILLVWDVINFCKKNDIPVGVGRGSAAGSLVLYLIGVTKIDPLKYDLYFERFISKTRAKKKVVDGVTYLDGNLMCDIDVDICYKNRHRVIEYINQKFKDKTCKISTLNSLQGKLLIKECGKVIGGYSEDQVKKIADLIPKIFGNVTDIEKVYDNEPKFKKWADENPKIYNSALKLRGLAKNKSVHASAMLLSFEKLEGNVPIEVSGSSKEIVSAYDMNWASVANVKLDLLGLRAVSIIDDVCKNVGINIKDIDFNDPFIYQQLQNLKTPHGLFQLEAPTVFSSCKKIKPKNLEELSGVMAIARPGALQFTDRYALYTNTNTIDSIHPFFDDILNKTGGLCLYQEQLMKMINKVGFSLDEAEIARRVVGKKKVEEVKEWKSKIENKVKENNLDPEIGDILWRILEDSASYSFNKSHSISYAALCAITIYLKFKYPHQFFLSLLKMTRNEPDPILEISKIHTELAFFDIELLHPSILSSELDFCLEGKNIRFGLLSIKGISDKSIEKLSKFKSQYSTKFEIFHASEEAGLSIGILTSLIQAGALHEFTGVSRAKMAFEAFLWNILTDKEKGYAKQMGKDYEYDLFKTVKSLSEKTDGKGKNLIKPSRYETIKRKTKDQKELYLINKDNQRFLRWLYEKNLLGYCPSYPLKSIFKNTNRFKYIRDIIDLDDNDNVEFVGFVKKAFSGKSMKNTKYHKMEIGDETGSINVMIFDVKGKLDFCKKDNNDTLPKEDDIVIVTGIKKTDTIFADNVKIQCAHICASLKDLKAVKKEQNILTQEAKESNI